MKRKYRFFAGPIIFLSALSTSFVEADPKTVLGYLEPYQSIEMNVSEVGIIGKIHVKEGDRVSEGQSLLSLDNSVMEAQLAIATIQSESTAAVIVADADLGVAKERYQKLSKLKSSGTAHSGEVARAEAEVKKAEGQLSIANEEKKIAGFRVEEIEAQIEKRMLRSPIDGVVLEISKQEAESATAPSAGSTVKPLIQVAQIDRLKLVVHVPASLADHLRLGAVMPVRVLQQSSLSLDREDSAVTATGTIEFISPAIDPSSETIRTRLVIENSDNKLRSGTHALVLFE
ncbi:MAG: efflux RND transporter periplasmic adaptor subunit [Verrucomicrobiales bacterium]|nr:efflux RND transporter periplasmic adaptor subunit [Verrucomicrobiales bacterium]